MPIKHVAILLLSLYCMSCKTDTKKEGNAGPEEVYAKGSFGYDIDFLSRRDSGLVILKSRDGLSRLAVSPKFQAKVFTSAADGLAGKSFGWVNYKAFDSPLDSHMNAYGGEDRLWLGPEGGVFSLYFKPGSKMKFENWKTPAAIDTEPWHLVSSDERSVSMSKEMSLLNYAGTTMQIRADRTVALADRESIKKDLGIEPDTSVKSVAFRTENSLTNTGNNAWNEQTGAPCMWNLDMFTPSEGCTIIIPYEISAGGKIATTDYFGEIAKDRIRFQDGLLYFKADGKSRGKLGIPPGRAKEVAGSYDAVNGVLTLVKFDIDKKGKYLNQEWRTDRAPFSGDAMNAYNDGPLEDGKQMGPFYEIESVSPAAFLKPGEKLIHRHNVYHFTGDKAVLSGIAKKVLGISVDDIEKVFNK